MKTKHKSYKPCAYFIRNECRLGDQCRYNHTILNQGELICFECGAKFSDKASLANHIRTAHGDMACKRSQCKYENGNCYYKHSSEAAGNNQPVLNHQDPPPQAEPFLGLVNHKNRPPGPPEMNQQQIEKEMMVDLLKKIAVMVMNA